jgi:hypothetical protein
MKVEPVEEAAAEEVDGETGVAMAVCGVDLAVAVSK